jgi:hypothetical protein
MAGIIGEPRDNVKVKVKFSLCLTKYHAIKMYQWVEA